MNLRTFRSGLSDVASAIGPREVLVFGGLAAVGYGIALIYAPAAWIVCGAVLFWLGMRV